MISAIVLAAGKAARFGRCKQLMPLGGKPLLQHTLDNLRKSKIDDVVVVLGDHADDIRREIRFEGERVIMNPDFAQGMSTSIQAGLRALPKEADGAMIVLADQPLVAPRTLDHLIDEYRRARPSVAVPTFNGFRGNPVIVDRSLFGEMMEIRGDIGCRAVFGDHAESIMKVPVDDRGVVTDIDTPEDLQRLVDEGAAPSDGVVIPRSTQDDNHPPADNHEDARAPVVPHDTFDLLETIVALRRRRQPFAMATVVRAERPTSSKPGDKAIIAPDGTLTGWIGGSCAHDIVVRNALESLEEGSPRFLTLSSASPAGAAHRQGVIDIPMQCYSGGVLDVFIEPNLPKPHMVVVGYESIARAVVRISKTLHFHVTVVDPLATRDGAPEADEIVNELRLSELPLGGESFIVIATHGRYDEEALEQAATGVVARAQVHQRCARGQGVDRLEVERLLAPPALLVGDVGLGVHRRVVLREVRLGKAMLVGVLPQITVHRRRREPVDHRRRERPVQQPVRLRAQPRLPRAAGGAELPAAGSDRADPQ